MMLRKHQSLNNGVIAENIQLNSNAKVGKWKIIAINEITVSKTNRKTSWFIVHHKSSIIFASSFKHFL